MPGWKAFIAWLMLVFSLGSGRGDDGGGFIANRQQEVQTIAEAAVDNYQNSCELVSTCLSIQNCSRLECYPFVNQNSETTCVHAENNKCNNSFGSPCHSLEVNFERSYIRTPSLNFTAGGAPTEAVRELYFGNTICTQRNLDLTFIDVTTMMRTNSNFNYFFNFYFASVDGSFRHYPGREILSSDCGVFDPRIRPWYTGAISILKDVVVLIDTGWSMENNYFFQDPRSYLEITKSIISMLVKTLTGGDRVTVVAVNASGSYTGELDSQYVAPANHPLNLSDPDFQGLLAFILSGSPFGGQENGDEYSPTSFTAGFKKAASIFSQKSPINSAKIVLLITTSANDNNPDENDLSAADDLRKSLGSQLFVYDLNSSSSAGSGNSGWGTHACVDGEATSYVDSNPLLWLNSYFSFLARARIAVTGGPTPFWQTPYKSVAALGEIITVAYPAMSADGLQLIGVAGIDVQLAGLDGDPILKAEIDAVLNSSPYRRIPVNLDPGNISICNTAYQDTCPGVSPGTTQSLCYPSQIPADDDQLIPLLCCEECTKRSHVYITRWICVGVVVPVVATVLILSMILWKKRRQTAARKAKLPLRDYSYPVLRKATNGFSSENVIGKGSSSVVYRAMVENKTVAVKQLFGAAVRVENFEAAVKILGGTIHPNLVELQGICVRPHECFLVYELIDGHDLHDCLWPEVRNGRGYSNVGSESFLRWDERTVIARGVARGLNYLHRGLEPIGRACHLAIRPHNILLECTCNPKITDFGVSQLYEPYVTSKYSAPELIHGPPLPNSTKLDVYSYGMVLLQLMSGRKVDDPDLGPSLLHWARNHVEDGHVEKVVDSRLSTTLHEEHNEILMANCKHMIRLALHCLSERPEHRPEMSEVLETIDRLQGVHDRESSPLWEEWTMSPTNSRCSYRRPALTLEPEAGHDVGSIKRNAYISTMTDETSFLENNPSHSNAEGPGILGRSSGHTLFVRSLEMTKVASEPKPRTLRKSLSS